MADVQLPPPSLRVRERSEHDPTPYETASPALSTPLRRILKHPRLMPYNRLAVLVVLVNVVALEHGLAEGRWWSNSATALTATATLAQANLTFAIVIREQHVINALHWLATRAPTKWPLKLRWALAKVYHLGGIHVGAALSATAWYLSFAGCLSYDAWRNAADVSVADAVVSYAVMAVLVVIVVTALPPLRERAHDHFEVTHRFLGRTVLVLVWVSTALSVLGHHRTGAVGYALLTAPTVWLLLVATACVAVPWLRLRRVAITVERPSSHLALVGFDHGVTAFEGSVRSISRNPLREWHTFATIPAPGRTPGRYRMVVSRAGDWTARFIDSPPAHVWVRGTPTAGMATVRTLFTKVVYVTTGSGIGPNWPS